jgi:hypothetical protein
MYVISLQKKKEREAAVMMNSKLTEEKRTKWLSVIKNEFMSSEESDEDDAMVVHPLPWRSEYVNLMFKKIDEYCFAKKSPQARRQTKQRIIGSPSRRVAPGTTEPVWAFKK